MKKFLIKILFKLLGFKVSTPCLVDGNDFIIKFNNKLYIMTNYTLEQKINGAENLDIKFTDILSVIDNKNKEKRWDY
jgi:hypothetical protein